VTAWARMASQFTSSAAAGMAMTVTALSMACQSVKL
jgi:hypothetical protein